MPAKTISEMISAIRNREGIPAINLLRDPVSASVISKLVTDNRNLPEFDSEGNRRIVTPDIGAFNNISNKKIQDINDTDTVMQMLPDLELAEQILVSSILSPKELTTTELTYIPPKNILPSSLANSISAAIKDYFDVNYKIESLMAPMLEDILFNTGSYVTVIIPENAIDELINNQQRISTESLDKVFNNNGQLPNIGLLGNKTGKKPSVKNLLYSLEGYDKKYRNSDDNQLTFSKESFSAWIEDNKTFKTSTNKKDEIKVSLDDYTDGEMYLSVTDNFSVLSLPKLEERMRKDAVSNLINKVSYSEESGKNDSLTDMQVEDLIFKRINYPGKTIVDVKAEDQGYRKSVGNPLTMHLPSESVIPVYVPGDPSNHIGYFVLLDDLGNPISKESNVDYFDQLGDMTSYNRKCLGSKLLDQSKYNWEGAADPMNRQRYDMAARAYGSIIERELIPRLKNGIFGKSLDLKGTDEIYRIMLSRALAQQQTQLLFMPTDIVVYMAFKYNDDGIGYSLLDKLKIVNSLRISLMLANTRTAIMNSIPRTKVDITLDEDDPDVMKRREEIVNEIMLLRSNGNNSIPLGVLNPADIATWASQANVEFQFNGAKDMPNMNIDMSEFNTTYPTPDTELEDSLRRRSIMGVGLSPEIVDQSSDVDFATTLVQSNLFMMRRVTKYQHQFIPFLTDYVRKIAKATPSLIIDLENILLPSIDKIIKYLLPNKEINSVSDKDKALIVKKVINAYLDNFEVSLPKPEVLSINNLKETFSTYRDALEEAINYYLSSDVIQSELVGDLGDSAETIKQVVMAKYLREWMTNNGYLPELNDLITTDEDGLPVYDVYEDAADYTAKITKSIAKAIQAAKPTKETGNAFVESNDVEANDTSNDYSDNSSDEDTSDEDTGDEFGGDDLNGVGEGEEETNEEGEENEEDNSEESSEEESNPFGDIDEGTPDNA